MQTRVVQIENRALFENACSEAVRLIKEGQVAALPTETVYGLAANALDSEAVRRIYEAKGRPATNPLIVHVSSLSMAQSCVITWPIEAERLARHFWPGPLTMVLPRARIIPEVVTGGGGTVGVRFPLHPFIRKVIELCEFPLAAPSANRANQLSPTTAEHVRRGLEGKIPLIVDGGPTSVGIESTVLDLTSLSPTVLRAGMISARQMAEVLGIEVKEGSPAPPGGEPAKSPGTLQKHYSPRARLMLLGWRSENELMQQAAELQRDTGVALAAMHVLAHDRIPQANPFGRVAIIPHDAEAYARAIYAELHRSDELGAQLILAENVPSGEEWNGIRDRLTRASA